MSQTENMAAFFKQYLSAHCQNLNVFVQLLHLEWYMQLWPHFYILLLTQGVDIPDIELAVVNSFTATVPQFYAHLTSISNATHFCLLCIRLAEQAGMAVLREPTFCTQALR